MLNAALAGAMVRGVQRNNISACVKHWVLNSRAATLLNSWVQGGCNSRPWHEVAAEIKALRLSLEDLEALGLPELFPGVIIVPPFGEKERRVRACRGRPSNSPHVRFAVLCVQGSVRADVCVSV